jgi:hypothetical protein
MPTASAERRPVVFGCSGETFYAELVDELVGG